VAVPMLGKPCRGETDDGEGLGECFGRIRHGHSLAIVELGIEPCPLHSAGRQACGSGWFVSFQGSHRLPQIIIAYSRPVNGSLQRPGYAQGRLNPEVLSPGGGRR
jgi:hypothetical protein